MTEARQRWRLAYTRGEEARFLSHLDAAKAWERAFRRGDVPIATTEGLHPRPRVIFAAPLPLGMLAERELVDVYLSDRLSLPVLRRQLDRSLPNGYGIVELHDVWLGAPALATQLVAADYRLLVAGAGAQELLGAVRRLLAAPSLQRERQREAKRIAYDLRPLLIDLAVDPWPALADGRPAALLRVRLRHSQDQGSGRAEEVVGALADELSCGPERSLVELEVVRPVRERLWLEEEMPVPRPFG